MQAYPTLLLPTFSDPWSDFVSDDAPVHATATSSRPCRSSTHAPTHIEASKEEDDDDEETKDDDYVVDDDE